MVSHRTSYKLCAKLSTVVVGCLWSLAQSYNMQTLYMHYNMGQYGTVRTLTKCFMKLKGNVLTSLLISTVYSSWEVGKLQCFQWIKERFNSPNVRFCVIGDGWEEREAAEFMHWPYIKIDLRPGCSHRFPGLTSKTVRCYLSVVYGGPDPENGKE